MSLKKMLVALAVGVVVVAGLALYVLVIEPQLQTTEEAKQDSGLVFAFKSEKKLTIKDVATKLAIHRGKEEIVLEKAGPKNWRLAEPVKARADRSAVLSILDQIKELRFESVAATTDDPEELAKFGLKEPRLAATLWLDGKTRDFQVGTQIKGDSASSNRSYFRVAGDSRVLVVDEALIERLNKAPAEFRDKHVFDQDNDPEKAPALKLVAGGKTVAIEKTGKTTWGLTSPVTDQADASKIRSVLSKARSLEAEKFVSEDSAKLADYGLDKPQLTCEIKGEDGSVMTLLIGGKPKDDDKALYARRAEEPTIFTVKADALKDLELKPDDVRQRQVADFEADDATGLEVTRGKAVCLLSRKAKEDTWEMSKPRAAKGDSKAVGGFASNLAKLRAERWVDDSAKADALLKIPEAAITVISEGEAKPGAAKKEPVRLAISAPVKTDKEEGFYIRRGDQKFALFVSSKKPSDTASTEEQGSAKAAEEIARSLGLGYLAFYDRAVFSFESADVTKLAVERGAIKLLCERVGENWKLTSPVLMDADGVSVNVILGAMSHLGAADYVAESPKDLKAYGLDAPALRIAATIEKKEAAPKEEKAAKEKAKAKEPARKAETKALLVSRKMEGKVYAMAEGGTLVFTVNESDATSLRAEPISTTIADFRVESVTGLTVAHRGKPEVVIVRDKETWQITKPTKGEADGRTVRTAVSALHDLDTRRYLDYEGKDLKAYSLDPPEIVVTVALKGEEQAEPTEKAKEKEKGQEPEKGKPPEKEKTFVLRIGKPVPGADKDEEGFYAQRGDAKQVFLLAKARADEIAPAPEAFETKPEPPKKEEKGGPAKEVKGDSKREEVAPPPKIEPKPEPKPELKPEPKAQPPKAPEAKGGEPKAP